MTASTSAAAKFRRLKRWCKFCDEDLGPLKCGDLQKRFPRRSELSLDASVSGVSIDMVEAAASRIRGYVRRTPMIEVVQVRDAPTRNPLYLKLESL